MPMCRVCAGAECGWRRVGVLSSASERQRAGRRVSEKKRLSEGCHVSEIPIGFYKRKRKKRVPTIVSSDPCEQRGAGAARCEKMVCERRELPG